MKLLTTIPPRSNDTVIFTDMTTKTRIVFERDADSGELVADVTDDAVAGRMLNLDQFEPLNAEDFDAAEALMAAHAPPPAEGKGSANDEDDDFTEIVNGGLPVEAGTKPVQSRPPKAQGRKAPGRARRAA